MQPIGLFGLSVVFSFVAWGLVSAHVIWPELRERTFEDAMRPLLILHSFRFVGLSFLIPGVVSGDLPVNFTFDAAYGDIVAAVLAIAALAALRTRLGIPLVWIFNLWGSIDLLNAFYQASAGGIMPRHLFHSDRVSPTRAYHARAHVPAPGAAPASARSTLRDSASSRRWRLNGD